MVVSYGVVPLAVESKNVNSSPTTVPPKPTSREIALRVMNELRSVPQGKALKISVEPGSGVTVDSIAAAVTILARERHFNLVIACGEWCLHVAKISDALDGGEPK